MNLAELFAALPVWGQWGLASVGMLFGMWLLTKSADIFVDGAVGLATRLKMPALLVGFIIVGFGTSAPEMLVSALAAANGMTSLSLGNAYGSNITNVLLILGASMLVAPIVLHRSALRRDIPFLLAMIVLLFCLGQNGFSRLDGCILIGVFLVYLFWQIGTVLFSRGTVTCDDPEECATTVTPTMSCVASFEMPAAAAAPSAINCAELTKSWEAVSNKAKPPKVCKRMKAIDFAACSAHSSGSSQVTVPRLKSTVPICQKR